MSLSMRLITLLALCLHMAFASAASATLTFYSDRAEFEAALPYISEVQSFENVNLNVLAGSRTVIIGTTSVEFTGDPSATFGVNNALVGGRAPTDGTNYMQVGFIGNTTLKATFERPLLAFGIDVVDNNVNSIDGLVDDLVVNNVIAPGAESNIQFWGVIASPDMAFSVVGFSGIGPSVPGDTVALDKATLLVVPEPAAFALLLLAGLSYGGLRLRR